MKKIVLLCLAAVLFVSAASAELLVTALPFGQGKYVVEVAGVGESNIQNIGMSATTMGGYLGYGVTDKLDLIVNAGQANASGLPIGITGITSTAYGAFLKYAIVDETHQAPYSLSVGLGYRTIGQSTGIVGLPNPITDSGSQLLLGIGLSKIMAPFVPYCGLTFRNTDQGTNVDHTQFDLTLGSAIAWSTQGAVFVEITNQSIVYANSGVGITNYQYGLGLAYKI